MDFNGIFKEMSVEDEYIDWILEGFWPLSIQSATV